MDNLQIFKYFVLEKGYLNKEHPISCPSIPLFSLKTLSEAESSVLFFAKIIIWSDRMQWPPARFQGVSVIDWHWLKRISGVSLVLRSRFASSSSIKPSFLANCMFVYVTCLLKMFWSFKIENSAFQNDIFQVKFLRVRKISFSQDQRGTVAD